MKRISQKSHKTVHNFVLRQGLDEREAGSGGDSTHVVLIPGHLHISRIAPASAPAVLDQPVIPPILRAVANHQHCVV